MPIPCFFGSENRIKGNGAVLMCRHEAFEYQNLNMDVQLLNALSLFAMHKGSSGGSMFAESIQRSMLNFPALHAI
jgi:hypothetical protein